MSVVRAMGRRGPADLLLAAEAAILLGFFRICLAIMPVRRILRMITGGHPHAPQAAGERELAAARRVQWAVSAVARHAFVEFVCFPQTLAGYTMLRCRKVPSAMVYGVMNSEDGNLLAHTWLVVGEKIVIGGEAAAGFVEVERWG